MNNTLSKFWRLLSIGLLLAAGCAPQAETQPPICPTAALPELSADTGPGCEDLARVNRELENWAEALVTSYSPGVWYYGEPGYPLFHHAVADPSLEAIAAELNTLLEADGNPLIRLEGAEGNTVHVSLSDDAALTQRMGSSGAQSYLQVVVLSLASLDGIDCVEFEFEEGDHARPGVYCLAEALSFGR